MLACFHDSQMSHLINHLNLSESQAVKPVHLNHVSLTMSFCQLETEKWGERAGEQKRRRAGE